MGHSDYTTAAAPGDARYFRLRAVDFDGTSAVTDVIAAETDCAAATTLRAYPNPANASTVLRVEVSPVATARTLRLVDVYGRTVAQPPWTPARPASNSRSGAWPRAPTSSRTRAA